MGVRQAIRQIFSSVQADVADLRGRIADLEAERDRIAQLPRDRATIEAMVDAQIARHAGADVFRFAALVSPAYGPHELAGEFNERFATMQFRSPTGEMMSAGKHDTKLFEFLAAFDPVKLKSALMASAPEGGISDDKRTTELARIERDLLITAIAEELACREIDEATGSHFQRRRDVPTAILLAPTSELEKGV